MKNLDQIILSYSQRGMDRIYNHYQKEFCKEAAVAFNELKKGVVFIYTGFFVQNTGETDGPIGAYFLYKGLEKLGFEPIILTDIFSRDFFFDSRLICIKKGEDTRENFISLLNELKPVANFSIERLGRDKQGFYKNSKNEDISEFTPKLDLLYSLADTLKLAIGDGGNEIGMGVFYDFLKQNVYANPCSIECDYPIIASVSNWGAYGFLAHLQFLTKVEILPSFSQINEFLEHILNKGAIDGLTKKAQMSVDSKSILVDKEILDKLNKLILNSNSQVS